MGRRLGALIGAIVGIVLVGPGSADAATFEVDSTPDVTHAAPNRCTPAPDDCSIRDAFAAGSDLANPDALNTITIPAGDYTLTAGDLLYGPPAAQTTLTIDGAGARETTIHGSGDRVFSFQGISPVISDLTITDGTAGVASTPGANDGGGIYIESSDGDTMSLTRVTLRGNAATMAGGAISAPPHSNSLLPANVVDISITDSTISGNTVTGGGGSGQGGGIQSFGDLAITNSTIANNKVENPGLSMGGGVLSAVWLSGGNLTVLNSTIAGNSITDPTGTGAGVATFNPSMGAAGTTTFTNTLVATNTIAGAAGDCGFVGTVTSDNNLSSDSSCQFTDEGSVQGTDPGLEALADNGGPTNTQLITEDSAAFDAGTNTGCPSTDQRGDVRPQGASCDIGAVEITPAPPPPPPPPPPPAEKSADVSVSLDAKPEKPELGQKVKFTFAVRNSGPDEATATVVTGKLPGRAKKVNPGEGCKVAKRGKRYRLRCDIGALANGANREFSVKVKPKKGVRKPRATIQATSTVADPNPANNKAKKKVTVEKD